MMKALKKNWFWVLLIVVVIGGVWYWRKNMSNTNSNDKSSDDEAKTPANPNPSPVNTTASNTTTKPQGDYIDTQCGGILQVKKYFWENKGPNGEQFLNQPLSLENRSKNKCATALLQRFLNHYEKAGLVVDGDFGKATEAAVLKTFGKNKVNLFEVAVKYRLMQQDKGKDTYSMVGWNTSLWPW